MVHFCTIPAAIGLVFTLASVADAKPHESASAPRATDPINTPVQRRALPDADGAEQDDTTLYLENYEEAVSHAENAFAFGNFQAVIHILEPWLYPEPSEKIGNQNTADGYAWLGASAWLIDDPKAATNYFKTALHLHPDMKLDPLVFPPVLLKFFEDIRREMKLDDDIAAPEKSGTVYIESRMTTHPLWVSMIPFGYGMFANHEPAWGAVYALTEGTLLTVSASLFWVNYAKRLPSDDLQHPMGYIDPENAQRRRTAHIATGAALLGIIVINMIHGALVHDRTGQVQYRTLDAPPSSLDVFDPTQRSDIKPQRWRVRIGPFSNY